MAHSNSLPMYLSKQSQFLCDSFDKLYSLGQHHGELNPGLVFINVPVKCLDNKTHTFKMFAGEFFDFEYMDDSYVMHDCFVIGYFTDMSEHVYTLVDKRTANVFNIRISSMEASAGYAFVNNLISHLMSLLGKAKKPCLLSGPLGVPYANVFRHISANIDYDHEIRIRVSHLKRIQDGLCCSDSHKSAQLRNIINAVLTLKCKNDFTDILHTKDGGTKYKNDSMFKESNRGFAITYKLMKQRFWYNSRVLFKAKIKILHIFEKN